MYFLKDFIIVIIVLFISGCGIDPKPGLTQDEIMTRAAQTGGFLYGTYNYINKTGRPDGNIALLAVKDTRTNNSLLINMPDTNGYFLFLLKPGTYYLQTVYYIDDGTGDVYSSQTVSASFIIKTNQITYLGAFNPVSQKISMNRINWGILSVSNNREEDIETLQKIIPSLKGMTVLDNSAAGLHQTNTQDYSHLEEEGMNKP